MSENNAGGQAAGSAPLYTARSGSSRSSRGETESFGVFWPLLLTILALMVWLGYQTYQLVHEKSALETARAGQEQTMANANKVRGTLDAIAASTAKLADGGNANARVIVDELKRRGITINPLGGGQAPGAAPAPPAAK